jgi:uncharacterized DUF497 family protein
MDFEWDAAKERKNIEKHNGISFDDAMLVFNDGERIERYDWEHSVVKDRWQTIGLVGPLLFVVNTESEDTARIISARFANPKEQRLYYGNYKTNLDGWYRANR